jgi:MobA/MobL family
MAIYHLAAEVGSRRGGQSAAAKFAYLCHQGRYSRDRSELLHAESQMLPAWAVGDPALYWKAADQHERANGRLYQQVEVALPIELTPEQQVELARSFALELAATSDGFLPYTLAVHRGQGRNPHAHILLSERVADGHDRTPDTWFRRAAPAGKQAPGVGGARKTSTFQPREWLGEVRARWAGHANTALERAGKDVRVDHRSHAARGLEQRPTVHEGPYGLRARERGLPGDRAALNAEIRAANLQLAGIRTQSATAQMQVDLLQRQLGQETAPQTATAPTSATPNPASASSTSAEAARFLDTHRRDFITGAEAVRWFDREIARLGTLQHPATARGLFEESLASVEPDFLGTLQNVLVRDLKSPGWKDAPLSVGATLQQARGEIAAWTRSATKIEQRIAQHRDPRSFWRKLLGPDPQLLRLQQERDSALAQVELHRATVDRIEMRWENHQSAWEQEAVEQNRQRREKQSLAAERLRTLRPQVLEELQRREEQPLRRQRERAEQAEYIRQALGRGVSVEELWLDLLLAKDYSREEQNELDALLRAIQAERKREAARAGKSRSTHFGVEWIGF